VVTALLVWRFRLAVERLLARVLAPPLQLLGRVVPRRSPASSDRIETGFERFFDSMEQLTTDRRRLAIALAFSAGGLVLQAGAMWVTFLALGTHISPAVPLFVIPVGTIVSTVPTPGGLGGVEAAHAVLLTGVTATSAPVVGAAIVIHRLGGFLLTNTAGGGALAVLRIQERTDVG
jgi:Predicted integral membrane protein